MQRVMQRRDENDSQKFPSVVKTTKFIPFYSVDEDMRNTMCHVKEMRIGRQLKLTGLFSTETEEVGSNRCALASQHSMDGRLHRGSWTTFDRTSKISKLIRTIVLEYCWKNEKIDKVRLKMCLRTRF